ncbi:MAG: 4-hydroxythreonine-4-phosphate dehydrogenase PdxA [Nitrospirae bacterium]|nr:4-hydroxythreonine-4-phosphate dehydrogenase PdxA [Nitrospirota bacterium]
MATRKPIIGITMGDPSGVGPEVIVKALLGPDVPRICRPVVIGDASALRQIINLCRLEGQIRTVEKIGGTPPPSGTLEVLDLRKVDIAQLKLGVPGRMGGEASAAYIQKAAELALARKIDAVTTGPINKEVLNAAGYAYPGHTEFLAALTGASDVGMMMVGGGLRIMLVTIHMALRDVPKHIKKSHVLRAIRLTHQAMGYFNVRDPKNPKIAVAALNPHAGEGRLFGTEEWDVILPAVLEARGEGIDVTDPLPADTLFFKAREGYFDAVVAMYHDQGLIPIKLLAFGQAVNVTVGLPFIRTSVDHGTAYDIAGKDCADPRSLIEAIRLAAEMVGRGHA